MTVQETSPSLFGALLVLEDVGPSRATWRLALSGVLFALLLLGASASQAAPGDLDPGFGVSGRSIIRFGLTDDEANAVALQSDGKIVVAGGTETIDRLGLRFAVARLTSRGSLDPSFGNGGKVITAFGVQDFARANAIALEPDGKIVVGGTGGNEFALARYLPDGSLDPSFGGTGKITTGFNLSAADFATIQALGLQPDGKIVAAGFVYHFNSGQSSEELAVTLYNADGSLDRSFGMRGTEFASFGSPFSEANALVIQRDGRIVVGGSELSQPGGSSVFALMRLDQRGSPDPGFGEGGIVTTAFLQGPTEVEGLALQLDGKILAAGAAGSGEAGGLGWTYGFGLARYNPNGTLDSSFGTHGTVVTSVASAYDSAFGVALRPDGKIVAGGSSFNGYFAVARYDRNGSLDPTFGKGGVVSIPVGAVYDYAHALALQPDGKVVVAGSAYRGRPNRGSYHFAVVRLLDTQLVCLVPNVRGRTLVRGVRALEAAHCSLGHVARVHSGRVAPGHIVAQRPPPGSRRVDGAQVNLVVSEGRRTVR